MRAMTARTMMRGALAAALVLAGAAGCNSSIGSNATGTAGSGAGAAGTGNSAGTSGAAGSSGTTGTGGSAAGTTGTGGAAGAAMPSAGCGKTLTSTADATITIDVSGTSRSFIVSVPSTYDANAPHRLVFAFHGRTGTAMQIAQGRFYNLKQTGRMPDAVFVAGQGLGTATDATDTGWPNTNGQDIAFVRAALAYMNTNYCVDQARVFSVGFSYGGIMSHTIACQMSDTFRAVAPMAGAIFGRPTCQTHPIAAWMTHGTMDTSAAGGVDFTAGESARDRIVTLNHCTTTTVAVDPSPCVAYQGCDGGYPVQWCQHDGAHVIPSFAAAAVSNFFLQF
jgi:poly(3-hydroxybutyrate) depolymerase